MRIRYYSLSFLLFFVTIGFAQNLLDTSTWTLGTGYIPGFSNYGSLPENVREYGYNHIGEEHILWTAVPENSVIQDGGIYTHYHSINNADTYRFSIWIKKTNSNDGRTHFGCFAKANNTHQTLKLNGTSTNNPYFWSGDLPELNKWYLLIGYIHSSTYTGTSIGGIYDGVTGELIQSNIGDFKFSSSATKLMLRAFLINDPNPNDRQYLFDPRIDKVNQFMPTVNQLMSINPNSKLMFAFDNAGNQKQRFYCSDSSCIVPTPPEGRIPQQDYISLKEENTEILEESKLDDKIKIYPNPTSDIAYIKIEYELKSKIELLNLYDINSSLIKELKYNNSEIIINLSEKPSGVYFLHLHLTDGTSITKRIIKK